MVDINSGQAVIPQEPLSPEKKKRGLAIIVGFLVVILLLLFANTIVPRVLMYFTRAASSPGQFSLTNSYVFGSPLLAAANGEDKIRITAFLLDDKGRGVPGARIDLSVAVKDGSGGALPQASPVQPITDDFGRAVFEVVSSIEGQFAVVALVSGLEFPQAVTLTFR
ncbi:Ig-like domain-containing protein [Candidatus Shapirobacteria bacterium]|nr:Ig-like domain-containing protein [Candidatus Shapirobacteria bacterium]